VTDNAVSQNRSRDHALACYRATIDDRVRAISFSIKIVIEAITFRKSIRVTVDVSLHWVKTNATTLNRIESIWAHFVTSAPIMVAELIVLPRIIALHSGSCG